jgi:hypothetical protein
MDAHASELRYNGIQRTPEGMTGSFISDNEEIFY